MAREAVAPLFQIPLIIAAVAVGFAIQLQDGEYTPAAISLITVAIVCTALAVFVGRRACHEDESPTQATGVATHHAVAGALGVGLLLQLLTLLVAWPGVDLPREEGSALIPFRSGMLVIAGLLAVGGWIDVRRIRRWILPGFLIVFLALGGWMVHASPDPHIDVWVFESDAARQLLRGHNPYAMTFPDIYHSTLPGHQQVYGSGLVVGDRCQFGFPYPPVTLLLTTLGYLLGGDPRYAQVCALALAGLFIALSGRGRIALLAAALLLLTPRVFFVIGRAWTEPFAVMLLAATIFCAVRRSRWLPVALGLFLATKQYLVLAVPFTFFLLPPGWKWRDWIGLLVKSATVAAIVTLPFALWDFHAFWKSTVTVQQIAPFRWDSLSYIVWWGFHGHGEQVKLPNYAVLPATIASLAALGFALWRSPRTAAGFAASLALLSLAFFAFNKQAFCNYYIFVIGALGGAIAASMVRAGATPPAPSVDRVRT
ncbi:MAG TPA: hypothetical protein VGI81_12425 [Tepidisphaeraceae bacterium]